MHRPVRDPKSGEDHPKGDAAKNSPEKNSEIRDAGQERTKQPECPKCGGKSEHKGFDEYKCAVCGRRFYTDVVPVSAPPVESGTKEPVVGSPACPKCGNALYDHTWRPYWAGDRTVRGVRGVRDVCPVSAPVPQTLCPCQISSSGNIYRQHTPNCPHVYVAPAPVPERTNDARTLLEQAAAECEMLHKIHPWKGDHEPDCAGLIRALIADELAAPVPEPEPPIGPDSSWALAKAPLSPTHEPPARKDELGTPNWKTLPDSQGWWWHWNGDVETAPFIHSVLVSKTGKDRYFSADGDLAPWCDELGGQWLEILTPSLPVAPQASPEAKDEQMSEAGAFHLLACRKAYKDCPDCQKLAPLPPESVTKSCIVGDKVASPEAPAKEDELRQAIEKLAMPHFSMSDYPRGWTDALVAVLKVIDARARLGLSGRAE